jgi:metallo-beta-lactamase family protein
MSKIKIKFAGGAGTATGSNFILEVGNLNIMIDCGLYQGEKVGEDVNRERFPYNPKDIDVLFITHGHLDHVGRIPKLVREGFEGVIISTGPTRDIGELVLRDSVGILTKEAAKENLPPIYSEDDVDKAMSLWTTKKYHEKMIVDSGDPGIKNIGITLYDSGHILGSSMIVFDILGERIMFTGDLGNSPSPLLKDTEVPKDINYLITESVYGDRNHEHTEDRVGLLKSAIKKTIAKRGTLMIPAFSVERTQELIYIFNNMVENKEIPLIPVFLDSPLGIAVTKVYKKYEKEFNENVEKIIKGGDDIFSFAGLTVCKTTEESKAINNVSGPKIIIAGAGMSNGGRIVHHEARYLPYHNNILLLVGYQAAGTMGRKIQNGMKEITINRTRIKVNAEIIQISGFSAHKDSNHIQEWIGEMSETLKKVFVVLGEPRSQNYLAQKLIEKYNLNVEVPELDEETTIEL